MKRRLIVLPLILLFSWYGCQYLPWGKKEYKPIFVGEPESIIVEPPEDAFDVSYRWVPLELPDESLLVPDFSSYSNLFTFTPDEVGNYGFAVTIISYGEEVSDHEFYYTAYEDTSVLPREEPIAAPTTEARTAQAEPSAAPAKEVAPKPPSTVATAPPKPKTAPASRVTRAKPPEKKYRSDVIKGHFTVQVSSWKTAKQAQKILQQVKEKGYDAYIQRVFLEDKGEVGEVWWRVRIGDYTSINEARALLMEISTIYTGAWVDNVRLEDIDQQQ
ncbi:MAG: SPOR domain-containing protein [Fidelibacterota bacterium]|nr:MAG: SPOR domain-containing protein [Candidatus Neomarinimicrobiota bacterium]